MDSELIAKFPCGGGWWKVLHPAATTWQQAYYVHEVESDDQLSSVKQNMKDSIVAPTHSSTYNSVQTTTHNKNKPNTERLNLKTICEYIMDLIDPCASLYTKPQRMDALQWLKQRLFNFVSSDTHMYLGPKKSRILSMWLSGNPCKPDSETIIREFIELLLGEGSKDIALHMDRRGNWFVKMDA